MYFYFESYQFQKAVDFTVPGIQMPKENAYGRKLEEVQVSVNGTLLPSTAWIHGSTFHGQISFVGEGGTAELFHSRTEPINLGMPIG